MLEFSFFFQAEKVSESKENPEMVSEDGVEDAFDVAGEIQEVVKTGESMFLQNWTKRIIFPDNLGPVHSGAKCMHF